jgi:hypothetical protein
MDITVTITHTLDSMWWEQFRESANLGIYYWADAWEWSQTGLSVTTIDGDKRVATWQQIADAAAELQRHASIHAALMDPGDLDPDAADMIAQQACLSEIVYG